MHLRFLIVGLLVLSGPAVQADEQELEFDEFAPSFFVDFGHIIKGRTGSTNFGNQPLNRNTVVLKQSASTKESWKFDAALMSIIWWPFNTDPTEPIHRTMRVEPSIKEAFTTIGFGSDKDENFLQLGYFPYKYNPDARNLGEYLYRSGTYPGVVYTTDGLQLMDKAEYDALGAHLRFTNFKGIIRHDINLFIEQVYTPLGDITPTYEASINLPMMQFGFGASYYRGIAFRPSQLKKKTPDNTIAKVRDVKIRSTGISDTVTIVGRLNQMGASNPLDTTILGYWNKAGLKLMARAAIDLGQILPEKIRGTEDFRIFFEAAILGVQNQGFFYEERAQRMPIMAGLNIPTFRLLDLLSFQVEYYSARFDNTQSLTTISAPVWDVTSFSGYNPNDYRRDDWKWTLYVKKRINRLFDLHFQAANDHLRLKEFLLQQSDETITRTPSHWYYLMRLEFGI